MIKPCTGDQECEHDCEPRIATLEAELAARKLSHPLSCEGIRMLLDQIKELNSENAKLLQDNKMLTLTDLCRKTFYARDLEVLGKLRGFSNAILGEWPEGSLDGLDIQETAHAHGLLVEQVMTEPCGEACQCAGVDKFPLTCFRKTALLTGEEEKR